MFSAYDKILEGITIKKTGLTSISHAVLLMSTRGLLTDKRKTTAIHSIHTNIGWRPAQMILPRQISQHSTNHIPTSEDHHAPQHLLFFLPFSSIRRSRSREDSLPSVCVKWSLAALDLMCVLVSSFADRADLVVVLRFSRISGMIESASSLLRRGLNLRFQQIFE